MKKSTSLNNKTHLTDKLATLHEQIVTLQAENVHLKKYMAYLNISNDVSSLREIIQLMPGKIFWKD